MAPAYVDDDRLLESSRVVLTPTEHRNIHYLEKRGTLPSGSLSDCARRWGPRDLAADNRENLVSLAQLLVKIVDYVYYATFWRFLNYFRTPGPMIMARRGRRTQACIPPRDSAVRPCHDDGISFQVSPSKGSSKPTLLCIKMIAAGLWPRPVDTGAAAETSTRSS